MSDEKPAINITSHNQSGGITAHTVHVGKPEFELTDELIEAVLKHVQPGKPVELTAVGGQRALDMARRLEQRLALLGHEIMFDHTGMVVPPNEKPLMVEPCADFTRIVIDPKA